MAIHRSLLRIFLSGLIVSIFSPTPLYAKEKEKPVSVSSELDFETRKAKFYRFELEPFGGEYLGNYLNNSWLVGARFGYRFNDNISFGAEFSYSRIQYDASSSFGAIAHNRNEYITDAFISLAFPMLQRTGRVISELDVFTTFGVGDLHINGGDNFVGLIGGGMRMYFKPKWIALKIDVNTYMYELPTRSGSSFSDDWTFTVGPSFLFWMPLHH